MPLFGAGKRTATVTEYARWFHTFDSAEVDVPLAFAAALRDEVAKIDARFAGVDLSALKDEFVAVRAEIFGVAWGHKFSGKDDLLLGECAVAKSVLAVRGLWEGAAIYNRAVTESIEDTLPTGGRARSVKVTFQNSIRTDLALRWVRLGVDKDCIGRVISRMFTEESWKKGMTLRHIEGVLLQRLKLIEATSVDLPLNNEALIAIQAALADIYQGTQENLAKYSIKIG